MTTTAFRERTRAAARQFLRSAVVVDDQLRSRSDEGSDATASRAAEPIDDPTVVELPDLESPDQGDDVAGELDADQIVRAFAELGILCAAITPDRAQDEDTAVSNAIARADLVVLDWDIARDEGSRALGWLRELADRRREGWTIVAIYTQSRRLDQIAERVNETLREAGFAGVESNDLVVRAAGVTVHVIPKKTDRQDGVTPESLPAHLVDEFVDATSGLLSNAALRGLSALRDATLAILRRFDHALDVGFAAQRVLLTRPADAEDQAVAVIAAEFAAALRDADIESEVGPEALRDWLIGRGRDSDAAITDALWRKVFKTPVAAERFEVLIRRLTDGGDLTKNPHHSAFELFDPAAESSNARFAHLMAVQSRHETRPPALGLGTVLHEVEADRHWLSIQPTCDSVRLDAPAAFPLLPLTTCNANTSELTMLDGETARYFQTPTKFRDLDQRTFAPDDTRRVRAIADASEWIFTDSGGRRYGWLADLREQHAQRIAARFAARLGRLGLEESEWQRRSSPRDGGD